MTVILLQMQGVRDCLLAVCGTLIGLSLVGCSSPVPQASLPQVTMEDVANHNKQWEVTKNTRQAEAQRICVEAMSDRTFRPHNDKPDWERYYELRWSSHLAEMGRTFGSLMGALNYQDISVADKNSLILLNELKSESKRRPSELTLTSSNISIGQMGHVVGGTVVQIWDGKTALVKIDSGDRPLMVVFEDLDTTAYTVDQNVDTPVLKVDRTMTQKPQLGGLGSLYVLKSIGPQ